MTRINCVPVTELSNIHLLAEYREMLRYRHSHDKHVDLSEIPDTYRLGTGHVKFFYDKGLYLTNRHLELRQEMISRGMTPSFKIDLSNWPDHCMNDWIPTPESIRINRERIESRIRTSKKPHFSTIPNPKLLFSGKEYQL